MKLSDVTDRTVRELPDAELLSLHRRCHQLFAQWRQHHQDEPFPWQGVHRLIADEMRRRGMNHKEHAGLDKDRTPVAQWILDSISQAEDYTLVPQYISIVGSAVGSETPGDVDIVVREDPEAMTRAWRDSIWVTVRDLLDPNKRLGVNPHLIANPQGPMYFPPHYTYVGLFDLVLRPNLTVVRDELSKEQFVPIRFFHPPKPYQGGRMHTDAFSPEEVWPWCEKAIQGGAQIIVQPKYNGYHATLQKKGKRIAVYYEDKPNDRWPALSGADPGLEQISQLPDCILDMDVCIIDDKGRRLPRPALAQLNADQPDLPNGYHIKFTAWDLVYWDGKQLGHLDYIERLNALYGQADKLKSVGIDVAPSKFVTTADELADAWMDPQIGQADKSEGIMIKRSDWPYVAGTTDGMIKIKHAVELKAVVLDKTRTKAGTWVYRCGLTPGNLPVTNTTTGLGGQTYVDMGETAPTALNVAKGSIITVEIEELTYDTIKRTLYWQNAVVVDEDTARSTPYTAQESLDVARRGLVLLLIKSLEGEGGDTRSERANLNWETRWFEAIPVGKQSGLRFILQAHFRGLTPEEATMGLDELLHTHNALHFDLRLETNRFRGWWGITLFAGEPQDNYPKLKIERMLDDPDLRLEAGVKQFGPPDWLDVGKDEPLVVPPGTSPTDKAWSKFFALDWGTYKVGMANRHAVEIILDGVKGLVKGRYMFEYAQVDPHRRTWLFIRPADQRPYAETHQLEDTAAYLAGRGHKYLFWPDVDGKIRMYKLTKPDNYQVVKSVGEQRYTLGVAYPANERDAHGDYMRPEDLERAAWDFLTRCQRGEASVGLFHDPRLSYKGQVVESYIWRGPDWKVGNQVVKAGDWLLGVIWEPQAWELIKSGRVRGYSIQGLALKMDEDDT